VGVDDRAGVAMHHAIFHPVGHRSEGGAAGLLHHPRPVFGVYGREGHRPVATEILGRVAGESLHVLADEEKLRWPGGLDLIYDARQVINEVAVALLGHAGAGDQRALCPRCGPHEGPGASEPPLGVEPWHGVVDDYHAPPILLNDGLFDPLEPLALAQPFPGLRRALALFRGKHLEAWPPDQFLGFAAEDRARRTVGVRQHPAGVRAEDRHRSLVNHASEVNLHGRRPKVNKCP